MGDIGDNLIRIVRYVAIIHLLDGVDGVPPTEFHRNSPPAFMLENSLLHDALNKQVVDTRDIPLNPDFQSLILPDFIAKLRLEVRQLDKVSSIWLRGVGFFGTPLVSKELEPQSFASILAILSLSSRIASSSR